MRLDTNLLIFGMLSRVVCLDAYLRSGDGLATDVQATHSLCDVVPHGVKLEDYFSPSNRPYKVVDTENHLDSDLANISEFSLMQDRAALSTKKM